jgi:anaphase-promoting complex subunit 2
MLQGAGSRFDFHINKTLCDLRTREIFDIIIDFPDSMGALQDLRECLQRVDQRANLVQALRKAYVCLISSFLWSKLMHLSNAKRLLHPGADTRLILQQYVATIKCLRIVDPPGVLLFKVADPIRRYLR